VKKRILRPVGVGIMGNETKVVADRAGDGDPPDCFHLGESVDQTLILPLLEDSHLPLTFRPDCVLVPMAVASIVSVCRSSAEIAIVTAETIKAAGSTPPKRSLRMLDFFALLPVIVFS